MDKSSYLLSGRLRLTEGPVPMSWRPIEDAVVLDVSTAHLDDVVRLEDRYGRTETAP